MTKLSRQGAKGIILDLRGNPGGNSRLELEAHERLNVRLLIGFDL